MKKSRRNKIIIVAAGILAVVIVLCLVLPGSRSPAVEAARKEGRAKETETTTAETGTKQAEQEKEEMLGSNPFANTNYSDIDAFFYRFIENEYVLG